MNVTCPTCSLLYDDTKNMTTCPDHPPIDMPDAKYCRKHDLFNCPYCTDSNQDAFGIVKPKDQWPKTLQ